MYQHTVEAEEVLLAIVDLHCSHGIELIDPNKPKSVVITINEL